MTVNITPSKFDICLLSGVIFNFACVTANYWPTTPIAPSGSLSHVYSDPVRIMGSYASSSPYYPPNYSYSSRMEPTYGPPSRHDPYYYSSSNRYPSPGPTGYGYSYNPPPSPSSSYGSQQLPLPTSGSYSGYRYPSSSSTQQPYYYRPSPAPYPPANQIPYQYWRNPSPQYDAFDRRGGIYGVPSSPYYSGGSPYPGPLPYGSSGMPYGGTDNYYGPRTAYAKLKGAADSKIEGEVRFVQQDNRFVGVTGRVVGLTPGAHGLHVHEGIEKDGSCGNIGGHFNPMNSDHGGKSEWKRHVS